MKKRVIISIVILILIVSICLALPPSRSYIVMSVYSSIENDKSVMANNDFKIDMPSDKGWYPFVITFNPVNFGRWSKTGADMSIMYNFAAFRLTTMSSDIFNPQSPMHSSFYGAYALSEDGGYFGFKGGQVDVDEVVMTFNYDYKLLVLDDLGCNDPVFEVVSTEVKENVNYLGEDGWTQIDAAINSSSMLHNYIENHTSYMQYGKPKIEVNEDFPVVTMYGRLYIRIFEEYNSTVIIYVMSPSKDTIEECDANILTKTKITAIS